MSIPPKPAPFAIHGFRGTIIYLPEGQFQICLTRNGVIIHTGLWVPDEKGLNFFPGVIHGDTSRPVMAAAKSAAYVAGYRCKLYEHRIDRGDGPKDRKPLTDLEGALAFLAANPGGALFSTGGYSDRGDDELVTDCDDGWTGVSRVTLEVKAMLQDIGAVERNSYRGFKQYRKIYCSVPEVAARLLPFADAIHEGRRLGMTRRSFEVQQDEHEKRVRTARLRRIKRDAQRVDAEATS